jgi:hypothetical protein
MDQLYQEALAGSLKSPKDGVQVKDVTIENGLEVHLNIYALDSDGRRLFKATALVDGGPVPIAGARIGDYYVVTSHFSDAFASVVKVEADKSHAFTIGPTKLVHPGDIGPLPVPTADIPVPQDSPRVLVAASIVSHTDPKKPAYRVLTREQYWKRSLDSYVLAPGQKLSISYTSTTGMQETTSSQQVLAESLGLSVGAGWGAISAGISGSISSTSSVLQQISLTSQNTRFDAMEVNNPTDKAQMFLRWQLIDIIQIIDMNSAAWRAVVAAVVSAEAPTLVDGPYAVRPGQSLRT